MKRKHKTGKQALATALSCVMILGSGGAAVYADDATAPAENVVSDAATLASEEAISVNTLEDLKAALTAEEGSIVRVEGAIELDEAITFENPITFEIAETGSITYTSDATNTLYLVTLQDGSVFNLYDGGKVEMNGGAETQNAYRDWRAVYSNGELTCNILAGDITINNARGRALYAYNDLNIADVAGNITMNNPDGDNRYTFGIVSYDGDVNIDNISGNVKVVFGGGNTGYAIVAQSGSVNVTGDISGTVSSELGTSHAAIAIYGATGVTINSISGTVYARGGSGSGYAIYAASGDISINSISGTVQGDCYNKIMANSQSGAAAIYAANGSIYGVNSTTPIQLSGQINSVVGRNDAAGLNASGSVLVEILDGGSINVQSSYAASFIDLADGYDPMTNNWGGAAAAVVGSNIQLTGNIEAIVVKAEAEDGTAVDSSALYTHISGDDYAVIDDFLFNAVSDWGNKDAAKEAAASMSDEQKELIENFESIVESLSSTAVRTAEELVAAVKNAEEGDVIKVYPGNYNIPQDDVKMVEGQTGWYLPIEQNNITIVGVDAEGNEITDPNNAQANIYSTDYSANGNWATQNLITVLGDNVTIKGLTIMNKIAANKALEVYGAANFTIENCKFAPIAEDLLNGVDEEATGYVYEEYKEYGASLYFNGDTTNATVSNNYFDHSGITLDSVDDGSISIIGNKFEGVKNWNNDPDYTYSTIGYTSWSNPPVTDISGADITIQKNSFVDAGKINFGRVENGSADVSQNYWGGGLPTEDQLTENVEFNSYYAGVDENGNLINLVYYTDKLEAVEKTVTFEQVLDMEDNPTNEIKVYLEGSVGDEPALIENLVAVDLVINVTGATEEDELAIVDFAPADDDWQYEMQANNRFLIYEKGKIDGQSDLNGEKIELGTLTIGGYGKGTITAMPGNENAVEQRSKDGQNIVISSSTSATPLEFEINVPKKTLAVNIDFYNNISDNPSEYQQMTATISGGDLEAPIVVEFGTDEIALENNRYSFTEDLTENTAYTVTIEGEGYRTTRYTVTMTGDKTLNFWNNVKDTATVVEVGNNNSMATVNYLAGDIVMNNVIDIYDLSAVVSYFGTINDVTTESDYAKYDLNRDGKIDSKDVAMVLVSWGK